MTFGHQLLLALAAALATISTASTCLHGPCGPGNDQCGEPFGQNTPQFHVRDISCGENDPNGPFELNGVWQLFYQDHLAIPPGHGPDWGHAVSTDGGVHWAHLPVAIWNDKPYDNEAIFTGSATVVDGQPKIIYPGLCNNHDWPNCTTGTLLAIAEPLDPSDKLLVNWTKPAYNPIMNNTQRDPSTAWQTPEGEWRITTYDTEVYASMDFKNWYKTSGTSGFAHGECPSFFPLPGKSSAGATHVHKASYGGKDWMQVGTYVPGAKGTAGTWTGLYPAVNIDVGDFYASKDFFDSAKQRRINWGWAKVPPASTQTLPRVITWDDDLHMLVYSPLPELEQLHGKQLVNEASVAIPANGSVWLGSWAGMAGNQSHVQATFSIDTDAATMIGIDVAAGRSASALASGNESTRIYVQVVPGAVNITAGVSATNNGPGPMLGKYMPGVDLPGADFNVTEVEYSDPKICEAVCDANPECIAWTYVKRPPTVGACCQKHEGFGYNPHNPACTSGVKTPQPAPGPHPGAASDVLRLKHGEKTVTIDVYVDNTFVEAYFQGGRVAMTKTLPAASPEWGMALFSGAAPVTATSVQAWAMDSIWVSEEEAREVLRQREEQEEREHAQAA